MAPNKLLAFHTMNLCRVILNTDTYKIKCLPTLKKARDVLHSTVSNIQSRLNSLCKNKKELAVMSHACTPSAWQAEVVVPGQPQLQASLRPA